MEKVIKKAAVLKNKLKKRGKEMKRICGFVFLFAFFFGVYAMAEKDNKDYVSKSGAMVNKECSGSWESSWSCRYYLRNVTQKSRKQIFSISGESVPRSEVTWDPGGRYIAIAGSENSREAYLFLYDLKTGSGKIVDTFNNNDPVVDNTIGFISEKYLSKAKEKSFVPYPGFVRFSDGLLTYFHLSLMGEADCESGWKATKFQINLATGKKVSWKEREHTVRADIAIENCP